LDKIPAKKTICPQEIIPLNSGQRRMFFLVHMPDPAGALMADHAWPYRCPGTAGFGKKSAVGWLGYSPQDSIADAG